LLSASFCCCSNQHITEKLLQCHQLIVAFQLKVFPDAIACCIMATATAIMLLPLLDPASVHMMPLLLLLVCCCHQLIVDI